jgi:transcriptional regulator GlxA family with amidase domain
MHYETLMEMIKTEKDFPGFLSQMAEKGVFICSVCNGTFWLGEAGLLDEKECTTHWRRCELLQAMYPKTRVLAEVLFVKDGNILTSAGITAGIDLALAILEDLTDPVFVNKVARGMVVYHRRSQKHTQNSIYLDYRNHINPKVHEVQDYLIENISSSVSIAKLANRVCMSPRNLSRIFKESTGITILDYLTKLRLEKASTIRNNPDLTVKDIASQCGFASPRQLQRIIKNNG